MKGLPYTAVNAVLSIEVPMPLPSGPQLPGAPAIILAKKHTSRERQFHRTIGKPRLPCRPRLPCFLLDEMHPGADMAQVGVWGAADGFAAPEGRLDPWHGRL